MQSDDKFGKKGANGDYSRVVVNSEFDTDLDEYVTCAPIFRKLRDLVNCWLTDVLKEDEYADRLISHVYRWLSSASSSKLYDPLLHRLVHKLMKKFFY